MSPPELKHIAVATDGSEQAGVAVDTAIDLTLRYQGQLTILAVAPIQPVYVAANEPFVA